MERNNCNCGGYRSEHTLGADACLRERCSTPVMLGDDLWQVDGGTPINTFTLTQTRLYRAHEDGAWSRPRRPVSEPTLSA